MAHKTWLITGAAGFIGSHVVAELLARGDTVVGVDNLYTGSFENIQPFQADENWHWFEMDIRDPKLDQLFNEFKPSHVIHLAAIVSVQECETQQDLAQAVNVDAFNQLLVLCKTYGVEQLFYASSSAVYGANNALPLKETETPSPISFYGQNKVANECDAMQTDMNTVGFRFFNMFGEHQSSSGGYAAVIPKWIATLRAGETPILYGDGSATRDFCHVSSVMQAIDGVLSHQLTGHHVFNIGTGKPTTLNDLYQMIGNALKHSPEPNHLPWRAGDIKHSYANIALAQKLIGFTPNADLSSQLQRLVNAQGSK